MSIDRHGGTRTGVRRLSVTPIGYCNGS